MTNEYKSQKAIFFGEMQMAAYTLLCKLQFLQDFFRKLCESVGIRENKVLQTFHFIRHHGRDVYLGMCSIKMATPILMY